MKKKLYMPLPVKLFLFAAVFFLAGCTSVDKKSGSAKEAVQPDLFEDWQYRGFGSGYPAWCEVILLNKDFKELENFFPEIQGHLSRVYCFHAGANTVDNASAILTNEELLNKGDKILAKTWVKINPYYEEFDNPYFSLILFFRDSQEDSQ